MKTIIYAIIDNSKLQYSILYEHIFNKQINIPDHMIGDIKKHEQEIISCILTYECIMDDLHNYELCENIIKDAHKVFEDSMAIISEELINPEKSGDMYKTKYGYCVRKNKSQVIFDKVNTKVNFVAGSRVISFG